MQPCNPLVAGRGRVRQGYRREQPHIIQRTAAKPFCPLAPHEAVAYKKTPAHGTHAGSVGTVAPIPTHIHAALHRPQPHRLSQPCKSAGSVAASVLGCSRRACRPYGGKRLWQSPCAATPLPCPAFSPAPNRHGESGMPPPEGGKPLPQAASAALCAGR
jgi:hypothetical protein